VQLSSLITAAGIDPATFDPLGVPFRPDGTGYDFVLDGVTVTVAASRVWRSSLHRAW
jgi:hypothetical protein